MTLTEYYKAIAELGAQPRVPNDPRVTHIELDFREGKGKEGAATIHLLDGKPAGLSWYIWDLDDAYLMERVRAAVAPTRVERWNPGGGNGHCYADLVVVE